MDINCQLVTTPSLVENGGILPPTAAKNSTDAAALEGGPLPIMNDQISHGDDRCDIEALRQQCPMRDQIWAESDGETRDTGQSTYAQVPDTTPSPWILHDGKFRTNFHPLKSDLLLPRIEVSLNNNTLVLDEHDYVPISKGWGFSLLGFFAGRFPGKEAVNNLTLRWKKECRISFHPKGWIVFRFEKEEHANQILASGPYSVFGIPLVLCNLPSEFRFDSSPELQFKVWVTLPNLPLELWNPSALAKIVSVVGTPLEVDYQTISKQNVAGPRVLVLVDATNQPPESINLQLHNGITFEQFFSLDCFPFFCTRCRRAGHLATSCRASDFTNQMTRPVPRSSNVLKTGEDGWTKVQNRRNRTGRSASRGPTARSKSRAPSAIPHRSRSRPPKQQWVAVGEKRVESTNPISRENAAIPSKIPNTHTRFMSPTPESEQHHIPTANRFELFDELEQVADAVGENHTQEVCHAVHTQPLVAAQMLLQPCSNAAVQAKANSHTNAVATSDLREVLGLPQRIAAANCDIETNQPAAQQVGTAPPIPTTSEGPTNVQQSILLYQGSADTHATEYGPVPAQPNTEAPSCSSESVSKPESTNLEQASPALENHKNQVPLTYASALSSPTNTLNAGQTQNVNKQRMEAEKLDPRDAIKKKAKGTIPSLTTVKAGRVLMNSNLTKNRK